jgi:hypothetical protein
MGTVMARAGARLAIALLCLAAAAAAQAAAEKPSPPVAGKSAPAPDKPAAPGATTAPSTPAAPAPPTEEEVAIAVADLTRAIEIADAGERAQAVERNAGVTHAKVAKVLARFLKDKDLDVRLAAIDALGRTPCPDALKELNRLGGDAKVRENPAQLAALFKAIGRHGSPDSLKVLTNDAWKNVTETVVQARLYAIGRIRTKAAVSELMDLMSTDPTLPWQTSPYMDHFRVALAALTGEDRGTDKDSWREWWNGAEKSLKVSKQPGKLPDDLQSRWDGFWKLTAKREPAK